MAKAVKLELTPQELLELEMLSRSSKGEKRMVERSRIILDWYNGKTYAESSSDLGVSEVIISKWRQRFYKNRLTGLADAPRSGKPSTIKATLKAKVIKLATSKGKDGYTGWSQRRIAKEVGISQSKVNQLLNQAELKPHKTEYWCGKSTDPEFEKKSATIIGLYLNPPSNALVICVDEKTQIQVLDRTQPVLPMKAKLPARYTNTYKRNGTVSLIAALSVHKGDITAKSIEGNTAEHFLEFLKELARKYPRKELHIIADNLSIHKHHSVKEWIESKKRITIHYTPTYSSWLNQIEIWFNIMSKDVLKGGVWKSKKQLVDQLMEYIKTYNQHRAKPFKWIYKGPAGT